mgnify:CR=1 FL=1
MNFIKSHDNFHYLDLSDSKAFDNAPYYNDTLMYYDVDHLNIYGSKVYAKFSGDKLGRLIEELLHKRGGYSDSLVTVDSISPL